MIIEWYERGPYQGYGLEETEDGSLRVWRANGTEVGLAGNITLAVQMMEEDE